MDKVGNRTASCCLEKSELHMVIGTGNTLRARTKKQMELISETKHMNFKIKRAYELASNTDGSRILVDRLWPRGVSREKIMIDKWIPEIAPSPDLRRWFDHDVEKWPDFVSHYTRELQGDERKPLLAELRALATEEKVTLIYAAKDLKHNHAVVLLHFLVESQNSLIVH